MLDLVIDLNAKRCNQRPDIAQLLRFEQGHDKSKGIGPHLSPTDLQWLNVATELKARMIRLGPINGPVLPHLRDDAKRETKNDCIVSNEIEALNVAVEGFDLLAALHQHLLRGEVNEEVSVFPLGFLLKVAWERQGIRNAIASVSHMNDLPVFPEGLTNVAIQGP